ncbi:MAG TPA: GTP-binding protein [Leifsonia sp.]|nr:GTP-binding protein [Leifsonia sp.]
MTLTTEDDRVLATPTTSTLFRFATAGSVDDGKSTLVGRLLHDSKSILIDQLEAVTRTSLERGFGGDAGGIDLALFTDGLRAEREQGITIDVAYRYFSTGRRSFILADCPGHVQYTRNMVTGATTADAVIVLVDARKGVLEQTRRHLSVLALLRVPHVIVAVNKIDLLDFAEQPIADLTADLLAVTGELGLEDVRVVPVSALDGDNVVERSARTPWYKGATLLELLETLPTTDEHEGLSAEFRLPVQLVLRPQGAIAPSVEDPEVFRDYRAYAGQLSSGTVRVGDRVDVHPGGASTVVRSITVAGKPVIEASAPHSVAIELEDDLDLARGALIGTAGSLPIAANALEAELFWLGHRPLSVGDRLLLKSGTSVAQARVTSLAGRRNLDTFGLEPAETLELNDIGLASIAIGSELPLDEFTDHRRSGAFLLIHPQDGATLAAGIVRSVERPTP